VKITIVIFTLSFCRNRGRGAGNGIQGHIAFSLLLPLLPVGAQIIGAYAG
jgi:hypothetical protein